MKFYAFIPSIKYDIIYIKNTIIIDIINDKLNKLDIKEIIDIYMKIILYMKVHRLLYLWIGI